MTYKYELSNDIIEIEHIKKSNIKHTYLRVISQNKLQIKSNIFFTKNDAINLIEKKQNWILKHINNHKLNHLNRSQFYYLGKKYDKKDFNIDEIDFFYKNEAKSIILPIVEQYKKIMNVDLNKISFRKNKTRWGSCSSKNNISLNTNLVKLPIELIKYVVVHELAHIRHKHHKKQFWDECEKYMPDSKFLDKQLKDYSCL